MSVCLATYNGANFIGQQLVSILSQLAAADEVIVSDDGSTDATLKVVSDFNDSRIKVFRHKKRKARFTIDRSSANFENALQHASGDFIFLSDQDDVWECNKLDVMMRELETCDMVMSDCSVVDEHLHVLAPSYYKGVRTFRRSLFYNFVKPSFLGSCMAFRRKVVQRAMPFPKYGVAHDLWLGMIGLRFYKFRTIDMTLMKYRRHSSSVTAAGKANNTSLWFKLRYRLYVLWAMRRLAFG